MSILFEPVKIHGMELGNRFVRSATYERCNNERGEITDKTVALYTRLALGGIGLIVTGYAYVIQNGQNFQRQTAVYSDEFIPGLKQLADKAHEFNAKIALQLAHSGRHSLAVRQRGDIPLAPSFVEDDPYFTDSHREMSTAEIEEIIDAFGQGARRAREAGFDAVQLHAAHSKLFSQFLSPRSNRRTDQWGGNEENRMRFHSQVISSIRKAVGQDYPLLIKLGVEDTVEGGLTVDEGCRVAQRLSISGVDAIEVSEGLEQVRKNHMKKDIKFGEGEAYYAAWSKKVKEAVAIPVILIGGMRSFDVMERIVQEGYADCISMCRPFIREPHIVRRWQTKDRRPARCISCNLCTTGRYQWEPIECIQEAGSAEKKMSAAHSE